MKQWNIIIENSRTSEKTNRGLDLIKILEGGGNLHDDAARLPLRYGLMLLQVEVKVVTVTVLEHGAEAVGVNLEHIVQVDNARVLQRLVDVVLPQRVLNVVRLFVVLPVLVELVDLAGNVLLVLEIEVVF